MMRRLQKYAQPIPHHPSPITPIVCPSLGTLLLGVFLAGCAAPLVPARVVYEDPVHFVRLEPDPSAHLERPDTLHNHPISIRAEQMAHVLNGFRIRGHRIWVHAKIAGYAEWEPVFREETVALLASRLTEALALAEPNERVMYYLSRPLTSIKREITTGGLYVKGTKLHFILSNHENVYGVPAYGMVYDRRYPTRPTTPKWFDLSFDPEGAIEDQGAGLLDYILGREKDEIVIDLDSLGLDLPVV